LGFICITSLPKFSDPGSQGSLFHFISVKRNRSAENFTATTVFTRPFRFTEMK
jgi:hypothetical protein